MRQVSFRYGDRVLANGIDLDVTLGEAVAVIGPSGSGKSTLLALLGGLLAPQDGTVAVEPLHQPPQGHTSWVLQTMNVLRDRSVIDNVSLGAMADHLPAGQRRNRAQDALQRVGLESRSNDSVRLLSGGEVQRVVIARALASSSRFILADEPTGHLDRRNTERVIEALLDLRADRGLLIVTHDEAVSARCDRVYALRDGRLVAA
jgi:ABC-type lipoprotein export system ATPase subunit